MSISKVKINDIEYNLIASNTAYGTCATAAATAAKVITTSSAAEWVLTPGARITIKFTYTNSASNPTFNVNGTGAKSVWYGSGTIKTTNKGYAGTATRPMDFIYDGTQYVFMGWSYDANTTYTNASLGQGYGTCSTAAATTAKMVTLSNYAPSIGGIVAVKFTYDVPANATMDINDQGAKAIYYKGAAIKNNIIKGGDTATFIYNGTYYHLISVDRDFAAIEDATYKGCYYRTVDGAKEWINPPMFNEVEYRTTERYLGKPVFTKTFTIDSIPANDYVDVVVSTSKITLVEYSALAQGSLVIARTDTMGTSWGVKFWLNGAQSSETNVLAKIKYIYSD